MRAQSPSLLLGVPLVPCQPQACVAIILGPWGHELSIINFFRDVVYLQESDQAQASSLSTLTVNVISAIQAPVPLSSPEHTKCQASL